MQRTDRRTESGASTTVPRPQTTAPQDAITLLKSDHREVESLFDQYQKASSVDQKAELADRICAALRVHTEIEEEMFYPAFLEATDEVEIHHEAEIEHAGAKNLISQLEESGPDDEYFDAKVKVLSEMIRHHVNEEEKPAGMFARAQGSGMDLDALGEQLQERMGELRAEGASRRH
ncbi:MAG TPA: hemerythrin domain-containing protein [Steroidobacteraceae bacterium]|nr:hemerythrin domain-containing protein [Steroidobacteraceae bacterium]